MPVSELWFVVPGDPQQNTGGYRYVRKLAEALADTGLKVHLDGLEGEFPRPDGTAINAMDRYLKTLPEGASVVLDGLAMGGMPEVLERHRKRLKLMALVHHPLADESGLSAAEQAWLKDAETRALACVCKVFTTSYYTARRLAHYGVPVASVTAALPAVDDEFFALSTCSEPARDPSNPVQILCVGHLSRRKAQHQLVQALAEQATDAWFCTLLGSDQRDSMYSAEVKAQVHASGLAGRIRLTGEVSETGLWNAYQQADLFVLPSEYEGYGMVVDEALACGLPVLSSDGGALRETGARSGVQLYPAGDIAALGQALARLLENPDELARLRAGARESRARIRRWRDTAGDFLAGLESEQNADPARFDDHWLRTREPADHRARNPKLTDQLAAWLQVRQYRYQRTRDTVRPLQLVDVGTGRGSNPVYLAPRLPGPQNWTLIEPDGSLAGTAAERVQGTSVSVSLRTESLSAGNMQDELPADADLVCASALIDLVSDEWLQALVSAVVARNAAVHVVLSYSGRFELSPEHPSDDRLRALVNQHQHGEKGTGAALGPDATRRLRALLVTSGYQVSVAPSPWQLDSGEQELALLLMTGWARAATEQQPSAGAEINRWLHARKQQLAAGELRISVEHEDLLAWPPA